MNLNLLHTYNLHLQNKTHNNWVSYISIDSPWLYCVHISFGLGSLIKLCGSISYTLKLSIISPMKNHIKVHVYMCTTNQKLQSHLTCILIITI